MTPETVIPLYLIVDAVVGILTLGCVVWIVRKR